MQRLRCDQLRHRSKRASAGAQQANATGCAFDDENIAIRGHTNEPRLVGTACEKLYFKSRRNAQSRIGRFGTKTTLFAVEEDV